MGFEAGALSFGVARQQPVGDTTNDDKLESPTHQGVRLRRLWDPFRFWLGRRKLP